MDKQAGQISDAYDSVSFVSEPGFEVRGTPLQFGRHAFAFEIVSPVAVVRTSEVLNNFRVRLRNRTGYADLLHRLELLLALGNQHGLFPATS